MLLVLLSKKSLSNPISWTVLYPSCQLGFQKDFFVINKWNFLNHCSEHTLTAALFLFMRRKKVVHWTERRVTGETGDLAVPMCSGSKPCDLGEVTAYLWPSVFSSVTWKYCTGQVLGSIPDVCLAVCVSRFGQASWHTYSSKARPLGDIWMKTRMLRKGTLTRLMTSQATAWPPGAQSTKFRRRCLMSRLQAGGLGSPPWLSPVAACRSLAERVGLLSSFMRWPSTTFTSSWGV